MPFIADFFFALFLAILLLLIFGSAMGARRPGERFGAEAFLFFLVLFLVIWAGGVWLEPFGPAAFGVFFGPFLIVGLIAALILAVAAEPRRRPHTAAEAIHQERTAESAAAVSFGVFFWVLAFLLVLGLVARYAT